MDRSQRPWLSSILPPVIIGGAAFSQQMQASPFNLPSVEFLTKAFSYGITAIDTSPYYGPSEIILGRALSHPEILSKYPRESYMVCTKVGRVSMNVFDYSPRWVRYSVHRSIDRLVSKANGACDPYLDLVFCHDVEYVSAEEMLEALGILIELRNEGKIRYLGISSYHPALLLERLKLVKAKYGYVLDAVQSYCHLTLQNTKLTTYYSQLKSELGPGGVVINSSPLAMGLLRDGGAFGDWHPAPKALQRRCSQELAQWCKEKGEKLSNLALKFSVGQMALLEKETGGHTIMGPSLPSEIDENIAVLSGIMVEDRNGKGKNVVRAVDMSKIERLSSFFEEARTCIGKEWLDYSWDSPPVNWGELRETNSEPMHKF